MCAKPSSGSRRGGFMRAVLVLVSGTALAHALTALALPFLSRLYQPADFGLLAVFSGLLSILSVSACLRYELAIPLATDDDEAMGLLALSLICAAGISALLAVPILLAPDQIASLLGQPLLEPYLLLLVPGTALAGGFSALQFWYVRQQRFALLARTRVAQSAAAASTQIGFGWAGLTPLGLLLGYMLNVGIACLSLGGSLIRQRSPLPWGRLSALAASYSRFPKYSTLEALANTAAIQIPIIMIAAQANAAEAGYLMLALYVMQAPMALIGGAISQVYLSRAADENRLGRLATFTTEVLSGLCKTGLGPLLMAAVVSPLAFSIVFGPQWDRAGWLVVWMTPWFMLQFITVPISTALHVTGRQKQALQLQLFGLALRVMTVLIVADLHPAALSEAYAVSGAILYGAYLLMILRAVKVAPLDALQALRPALRPAIGWLGAGAIAVGTMKAWLSYV